MLGPLFFLIYVNDIYDVVSHSTTKLFADDVAIYKTIDTIEDCSRLQEDLNRISSWADKWQLKLNANKCEALLISRKRSTPKFDYHIIPLFWKPLVRYLGIHINGKLDWTDHCKVITAKATRCLNFLRHSMWSAPRSAKSLAYQSIIRPLMEYGCQVWNYIAPFSQVLLAYDSLASQTAFSSFISIGTGRKRVWCTHQWLVVCANWWRLPQSNQQNIKGP